MGKIVEIQTERLVLKPLGAKYLETTFKYSSDIENTRYMLHLPNQTQEETQEFLEGVEREWQKEKQEFYEFAVILDGVHIGAVCIYPDGEKGELGWILDKGYWGHGYAYEAAQALIDFAAGGLGVTHFIAHCDSENCGSFRLMEELGMERTKVQGGRRNRSSDEEREEYQYEMYY